MLVTTLVLARRPESIVIANVNFELKEILSVGIKDFVKFYSKS
jgi:hypothetical protein